jgi:hypothetical protein
MKKALRIHRAICDVARADRKDQEWQRQFLFVRIAC